MFSYLCSDIFLKADLDMLGGCEHMGLVHEHTRVVVLSTCETVKNLGPISAAISVSEFSEVLSRPRVHSIIVTPQL